MVDIAVVSVVSATAVGLAGALDGPLTARGNRAHERAMQAEESRAARLAELHDRRRTAYIEALAIAIGFRWTVVNEGKVDNDPWPNRPPEDFYRAGAEVLAWGSAPVIELWTELVGDALSKTTDHVTDDLRDRVVALAARLRRRIHAELCAIEDDLRVEESSGAKVL